MRQLKTKNMRSASKLSFFLIPIFCGSLAFGAPPKYHVTVNEIAVCDGPEAAARHEAARLRSGNSWPPSLDDGSQRCFPSLIGNRGFDRVIQVLSVQVDGQIIEIAKVSSTSKLEENGPEITTTMYVPASVLSPKPNSH